MFSQRTNWESTPNPLTAAWERRRASGLAWIDLTESNPTRCGFDYPRGEILRALADPRGLTYEPAPKGLRPAREAVASDLAESRIGAARAFGAIDPEHLVLTSSTSEAYGWLFKLLCGPGDAILVPRPSYPLLGFLAELEETVLTSYPLRYDGEWHIDVPALVSAITPRTRAVVVVHPNNPTGSFVSAGEADALGRLCAERGLAVISDEVFSDYAWRGAGTGADAPTKSPSGSIRTEAACSLAENSPCLSFVLGGLSKSAGLPQIKLSWIRVGGPEGLRHAALSRLEIIADTYLSVGTPVQWALPELLRLRHGVRREILERVERNRAWLEIKAEEATRRWGLQAASGGWSSVLQVPRTRTEEEWCLELVATEGILVHPGYFFDFESEAHLVVSLLPEPERFSEAMERLWKQIAIGS